MNGKNVINAVISLVVFGLIFWLLKWLLDALAIPQPFHKVAEVILIVAAVVLVINVLLSLIGKGFITWKGGDCES